MGIILVKHKFINNFYHTNISIYTVMEYVKLKVCLPHKHFHLYSNGICQVEGLFTK